MWKWIVATVVVTVLAVGAWLFEPWRLFTSSEIDEAAPTSSRSTPVDDGSDAPTGEAASEDEELARGDFETAEHDTAGEAVVLSLADGRRFVRFEGLATSDGPDLHVWLTDQPSGGDWGSYDDGRYVKLGELKATHGNQNYEIPADADLSDMRSVVIWCARFNVAFGTAAITL